MSRIRCTALTLATVAAVAYPLGRTWARQWGSTEAELDAAMPGDAIVPDARAVATRSITVRASADDVWAWLVQIGQDRGGFYSYDWLENLVGLHIRSADRIEEHWQGLAVGDAVRLAPQLALEVALLEPGRHLVLRGPDSALTWAFTVARRPDGTTRLVARERYAPGGVLASLGSELLVLVSAAMTRRMLMGIRDRAEHPRSPSPDGHAPGSPDKPARRPS